MTSVDVQRSRVYDAEALVRRIFDRSADFPIVDVAGSRVTLPVERKFASLDSVQTYVDAVLALNWVRQKWPRATRPIRVRERAGQNQAHYEWAGAVIAVPLHQGGQGWALRELVLLHEIAHHLAGDDDPAHGPDFTARMLELVGEIVGVEAGFLLRVTLLDSGVRIG